MNIFVLHDDPYIAAKMHCDKHIPKMIVESAQMLSTAHRILDGEEYLAPSKSGKRTVKHYKIPLGDDLMYKAVHAKHPCTLWTMEAKANYYWHYRLWHGLSEEYTYRFGKQHASWEKLKDILLHHPRKIQKKPRTPHAIAMPDKCKRSTAIESYREYYLTEKNSFAKWERGRPAPDWWNTK